ncbi:MAG: dihydrofolate reductase family protein, partial [Pseudomonadota bacterium]
MLHALGERGINSVLCEGGGQLAAALLRAGLVDSIVQFTAGMALGAPAIPAIADLGIERLSDVTRFDLAEVTRIGADTMSIWVRPDL